MKTALFIGFLGSFFLPGISLGDSLPKAAKGAYDVKSCFGSEPLWSLEISERDLTMEGPFDDEKLAVSHSGVVTAVGYPSSIMVLYQGALSDTTGNITVIIKQSACSFSKNHTIYPYSVAIIKGNALYQGCCLS
jgi:uncharacterized membrane protein